MSTGRLVRPLRLRYFAKNEKKGLGVGVNRQRLNSGFTVFKDEPF